MSDVKWAVLAPQGFLAETLKEAQWRGLCPVEQHGDLLLFAGKYEPLCWAAVNWKRWEAVEFSSIAEGARKLRPLARKWAHASTVNHRRGELILDQLRAHKVPLTKFPHIATEEGLAAFALTEPNRAIALFESDRPDPLGVMNFAEDKTAPSRAYLKLWEALTLVGAAPRLGEKCFDLGSCPGGWTWVAASLGAHVTAVDRAPLAPEVAAMPGVEFRMGDAFKILPETCGEIDWLFSDVICYPEKLFALVEAWAISGKASHMVCTIKFQGEPDPAVIEKFRRFGRVLHLHYNKHELTFLG